MPAETNPLILRPGLLRLAAEQLARMLRASATWQTLTAPTANLHEPDVEGAVYIRSVPGQAPLPWACIQAAEQVGWQLSAGAGGAQNFLRPNGSLLLVIDTPVPTELADDAIKRELWALDAHAQVLQEVVEQSGVDDLLAIAEVTLLGFGPPHEQAIVSHGLDFESVWQVRWGDF